VFTGEDPEVLARWRELFATEHYHVWTNTDFVGVEVCAATKNCYAFGAGFMQGLLDAMGEAAGDRYVNYNYGAALFGQASVEMIQFMELLGGKPTTPIGLPGIGDCFVTSMGGRNVRCGRLVGSGMTFSQARAQISGQGEGERAQDPPDIRLGDGGADLLEVHPRQQRPQSRHADDGDNDRARGETGQFGRLGVGGRGQGDQGVLDDLVQAGRLGDGQPVVRVVEDDDVPAPDLVDVVHGHGHAVALGEGVLHRARRDDEGLDDRAAYDDDDDQDQEEGAEVADQRGQAAPAAGRGREGAAARTD